MSLFDPITLRGVTVPNRIAVSPMSQYISKNGYANDWHLVHLGRFALGGAGLVFTEATGVEARGRRTHGDLGLWEDGQIDGLARVARFLKEQGAVPGIQLGHAGRKASERRPWHGETPVDDEDVAERGEAPWEAIAPSALPYGEIWPSPREMSTTDIETVVAAFGSAAARADAAGFEVIDIYAGHGFLVHQFYSPIANERTDYYGGSRENRMRFAVDVADSVRANWPGDKPLIFRISAVDWVDGGWELEDTIALANTLKAHGVDMLDCSTGGIGGLVKPRRMTIEHGFQVPYAEAVKKETGIGAMGVGFLWDVADIDRMVVEGRIDMVALARELLDDPNWPLHAARELDRDPAFDMWKPQFGWWLNKRARLVGKLGLR
ncbi:MAG: NADH:flavin oxidoreductase/NADH oxidase [Pseudomonadota bacterium]